ncbi:MAG: DNA repair protein RecO [Aquificae bacterium]|nr:DNA repair protein RecO [Aquificota bacterium]
MLKDEAIVLRRSAVGDYDLSLTVYMKKQGKENIYIKQGQRLKSPFLAVSEPFTWFKGVFVKRRENFSIKEVEKSVPIGRELAQSVERFYTGYRLLDLFNRFVIYPDEKVFVFLKKSIYYLTKTENRQTFTANFLAKLIYLSGVFPEVERCVRCGRKVNGKNYRLLSVQEGGVVCTTCSKKRSNLPYSSIRDLKRLKTVSFKELDRIKLENPSLTARFLNEYLEKSF